MSLDDQLGEIEAARRERVIGQHLAVAAAEFELDVERSGVAPTPAAVRHLVAEAIPKLRAEIEAKADELAPLPALSAQDEVHRQRQQEEARVQARIEGQAAAVRRDDAMADDPTVNCAAALKGDLRGGARDEDLVVSMAVWSEHGANVRGALEAAGGDQLLARARDAADRLREARASERGRGFKIPGRGDTLYVLEPRRAS